MEIGVDLLGGDRRRVDFDRQHLEVQAGIALLQVIGPAHQHPNLEQAEKSLNVGVSTNARELSSSGPTLAR